MNHGRKINKFKQWILRFFVHKREIYHTPDGPQLLSGSSSNNRFVEVNNAIYVQGVGNTVLRQDGQADRNMIVTHCMTLLSHRIIRGAAHDDSARDPPPRCHPDTRVKLIARITAWFNGKAQQELLLWITGPAGVGKSAIVQTFAEYLAKNHLLGASVFISRPNRRNNSHGIFVTIAYQLCVRFEAYRNFITERLSIDPELLSRGMVAQFASLIVEPFVEKKIGAGGKRWGILLDGLDELEGEDAQCKIIQLITAFVHEHRDTPLVWIIASRPEPHISNTFADDVNRGHWSEYIPIDSTEACEDVERFLRSSFETTRKKFRQCVPRDWPSDTEFLKLTAAASGLFVYAEVVMHFIRDGTQADPVARLELLSSVIDRSNAVPTEDNPFVHLDALYTEILSSISPTQWPLTRRLLSYTIHVGTMRFGDQALSEGLQTFRGMAMLFGLLPHAIYACLLKCHSTLRVPDWKVAHKKNLTFLHASFADFLKDPIRSRNFHVGNVEDIKNDVVIRVIDIWNRCNGGTVESTWHQYCSEWDNGMSSRTTAKFHTKLFHDVVGFVRRAVYSALYGRIQNPIVYAQLHKIHMTKLCYYFDTYSLWQFARALIDHTSYTNDIELFQNVQLKDLKFGNLNWEEMGPVRVHRGAGGKKQNAECVFHRPRSHIELKTFVSELESLRKRSPELEVIVFGGLCEGRIAAFRLFRARDGTEHRYIIPYIE